MGLAATTSTVPAETATTTGAKAPGLMNGPPSHVGGRKGGLLTANDAIHWAESRACKDCRKSDSPAHAACSRAQEAAELIRRLTERVS